MRCVSCTVQNDCPVLLPAGNGLEVFAVHRAGIGGCIPTADNAAQEQVVVGIDRPINPGNTVVATCNYLGQGAVEVRRT